MVYIYICKMRGCQTSCDSVGPTATFQFVLSGCVEHMDRSQIYRLSPVQARLLELHGSWINLQKRINVLFLSNFGRTTEISGVRFVVRCQSAMPFLEMGCHSEVWDPPPMTSTAPMACQLSMPGKAAQWSQWRLDISGDLHLPVISFALMDLRHGHVACPCWHCKLNRDARSCEITPFFGLVVLHGVSSARWHSQHFHSSQVGRSNPRGQRESWQGPQGDLKGPEGSKSNSCEVEGRATKAASEQPFGGCERCGWSGRSSSSPPTMTPWEWWKWRWQGLKKPRMLAVWEVVRGLGKESQAGEIFFFGDAFGSTVSWYKPEACNDFGGNMTESTEHGGWNFQLGWRSRDYCSDKMPRRVSMKFMNVLPRSATLCIAFCFLSGFQDPRGAYEVRSRRPGSLVTGPGGAMSQDRQEEKLRHPGRILGGSSTGWRWLNIVFLMGWDWDAFRDLSGKIFSDI